MCSPSWRSRIWRENAFWEPSTAIPVGPARELRTETTSQGPFQSPFMGLHSGKVDSPRGTNHSPNASFLRKATLAYFSRSPLVSIGQKGLGCLWLRGTCCFAGGLLTWKPTPNVFSFVEKQELAGKCLVGAGPSNSPGASWEVRTEAPSHRQF